MSDPESIEECGMENVVSVRIIQSSFKSIVSEAIDKMMGAKLVIDRYGLDGNSQESQEQRTSDSMEPRLGEKLTVLINDISISMKRLEYAPYRGTVHKKCEGTTYTYSYKCDVKAFVNSLAAKESFKARMLRDVKKVIDILADPDWEVIRPIVVDYTLMKVNEGKCWSVSERRFLNNTIPAEKMGLVTPRAFSRYDPSKVPQPKYFQDVLKTA